MKKTIIAFYDVLLYSIVCSLSIMVSLYILFSRNCFSNFDSMIKNWYLVLSFAFCIAIPVGVVPMLRYFKIINNESVYFHYFPFTTNWTKAANNIDIRWNQEVFVSEIESVEVLKLSKATNDNVFYDHWRNKYLKINLKYGKSKFVYIGNYSKIQIDKIMKLLLAKQ